MNTSHNILAHGAAADLAINSAPALQRAIDAAHAAGGGTVIVPAGLAFMCGSLLLRSRVRLHLEPGSRLVASPDIADYVNYDHLPLFRDSDFCRFWLFAHDADEVTIDGSGTLDGNSPAFVTERLPTHTKARNPRAQSVVFLGCRDIVVRAEQGIYIQGADGQHPPSDLLFANVRVHLHKHTAHPCGFFDPRPNAPGFAPAGHQGEEEPTPWGTLFRHGLPAIYLDRTHDVTFRDCRVTWEPGLPAAYTHALEAHASPGLVLENFHGAAAQAALPALSLHGPAPLIR